MPTLAYGYVARGAIHGPAGPGSCPGGPGVGLVGLGSPIAPTWPQLYNAQTRLGVYPAGWAAMEMAWRVWSLRLSANPPPAGGPGVMTPSPVVTMMDATEKGQLSYHAGTAAGLRLALSTLAPGAGAILLPFHLSRAIAHHAHFTYANASRPDLTVFSIVLAGPAFNYVVVWECKGHARNVGQAPLGAALNQSVAITGLTALPGGAVLPAPVIPAAFVASQVDVVGGAYRLQATDPSPPSGGFPIKPEHFLKLLQAYYAPFIEVLNSSGDRSARTYEGRLFETVEIIPKIRFGMDAEIYAALFSQSSDVSSDIGRVLSAGYKNLTPDELWIDETGLSLELEKGWASF